MKTKTLAPRFSFMCVQANETTLRSISLKRQHSKSLLELTDFQKRSARVTDQIKNRIQTVVQCLNLLFIKKFINLVNMSSKLQKSQMKIRVRGSQTKN